MTTLRRLLFPMLVVLVAAAHANDLTGADFEGGLEGKSLFVVFHAPWCGHCKALMPAWKEVTKEIDDVPHLTMARVDCTDDGNKALCAQFQVQGYPTILFGSTDDLQPYEGGRDKESLATFARDIKPACGVGNEEHCSEEDAETLRELAALDAAALQARIDKHGASIEEVEASYKTEVEKLQARYSEITETKKTDLESIRGKAKIGLVKSALRKARQKGDQL